MANAQRQREKDNEIGDTGMSVSSFEFAKNVPANQMQRQDNVRTKQRKAMRMKQRRNRLQTEKKKKKMVTCTTVQSASSDIGKDKTGSGRQEKIEEEKKDKQEKVDIQEKIDRQGKIDGKQTKEMETGTTMQPAQL